MALSNKVKGVLSLIGAFCVHFVIKNISLKIKYRLSVLCILGPV